MTVNDPRRLIAAISAGVALFLAASPALGDVKAGVDAWSTGNYQAAVKEWKGPADRGDPDAQFNMGQAYKLGRGVDQDLSKAENYYARAAANGHLRAADNYGLLLFQRGERDKAMPLIEAAAARGDARAQYILGLAHFNGDHAPKDWVRAYALVSLAQQAGLSQATNALNQMDEHIPLKQRQESVLLAAQLAQAAATNRASQVAAVDLGVETPGAASTGQPAPRAASAPPAPPSPASPATAGADFARPQTPVAAAPAPKGWIEIPPASQPRTAPVPAPSAAARPPASAQGPWRVQLGAFGVSGNADKLWARVSTRPELAGHGKLLVSSGRLTKLQAGGFASKADADGACARLEAAGFACLTVKD